MNYDATMKAEKWTQDQILAMWKAKSKAMLVIEHGRHKDFSLWHATHMDDRIYHVQITPYEIIVQWR